MGTRGKERAGNGNPLVVSRRLSSILSRVSNHLLSNEFFQADCLPGFS